MKNELKRPQGYGEPDLLKPWRFPKQSSLPRSPQPFRFTQPSVLKRFRFSVYVGLTANWPSFPLEREGRGLPSLHTEEHRTSQSVHSLRPHPKLDPETSTLGVKTTQVQKCDCGCSTVPCIPPNQGGIWGLQVGTRHKLEKKSWSQKDGKESRPLTNEGLVEPGGIRADVLRCN